MGRYKAIMDVRTEYNDYLDRLEEHLRKLSNETFKEFKVGKGTIRTSQRNKLQNPNGWNKWNGWKTVGTIYRIVVLDQNGQAIMSAEFEDKDRANKYYTEYAKPRCLEIKDEVWFE